MEEAEPPTGRAVWEQGGYVISEGAVLYYLVRESGQTVRSGDNIDDLVVKEAYTVYKEGAEEDGPVHVGVRLDGEITLTDSMIGTMTTGKRPSQISGLRFIPDMASQRKIPSPKNSTQSWILVFQNPDKPIPLSDMEWEDLSKPFMLENAWVWEDEDVCWDSVERMVYNGNIELISLGDCMSYNLIITGKCRGEVWFFTDVGVQPCCQRQDFFGWFEKWLNCGDEVDYFSEYKYE